MLKNCLDILVCPQCKSELACTNQGLYCRFHDKSYAVQDNLLRFSSPTYSRDAKWIKDVSTINNIGELKSLVFKSNKSIYPWIFSCRRSDFLYLLSKLAYSNVNVFLDAGAGFGNVINNISQKANCAYALDISYENVLFAQKLSELQGNHVIPILEDISSLPFRNSVDVALMDGVLEWVGTSKKEIKDAEIAQLDVLSEVRKALEPKGTLVIAIENRFSPFYLWEKDHQGLFWTSFLPRRIANWESKLIQRKEYSTYTHDYWGYRRLLTKAGFRDIRIFGCFPNYRFPQFVYSLEDEKSLKFIASHKHLNMIKGNAFFNLISANLDVGRLLSPAFIIFAFKHRIDQETTFTGDLVISGWGNFAKIIDLDKGLVVSVLRTPKLRETLFRNIQSRPRHRITSDPKIIEFSKEFGYVIEKFVDGEPLSSIAKRDKVRMLNLLEFALSELFDFYYSQKQTMITTSQYQTSLMNSLCEYKKNSFLKPYEDKLDEIINIKLEEKSANSSVPIVYVHGDLNLSNILYSESKNKIFFIDWEYGRKACLFHDILLLISRHAFSCKRDDLIRDILVRREFNDQFENLLVNTLYRCLESTHLYTKVLRNIYSIFLQEYLASLFELGGCDTSYDSYREFDFLLWLNRALRN